MVNLSVCIGSACHIKGSYNMISMFQQMIEENQLHDKVELKGVFCMGNCGQGGVGVRLNDGEPELITVQQARTYFKEKVLPLAQ